MLKKNCPECGSIIEVDETKFPLKDIIKTRCQLCGTEIEFDCPKQTETAESVDIMDDNKVPSSQINIVIGPKEHYEQSELRINTQPEVLPTSDTTFNDSPKNHSVSRALIVIVILLLSIIVILSLQKGDDSNLEAATATDSISMQSERDYCIATENELNALKQSYTVLSSQLIENPYAIFLKGNTIMYWNLSPSSEHLPLIKAATIDDGLSYSLNFSSSGDIIVRKIQLTEISAKNSIARLFNDKYAYYQFGENKIRISENNIIMVSIENGKPHLKLIQMDLPEDASMLTKEPDEIGFSINVSLIPGVSDLAQTISSIDAIGRGGIMLDCFGKIDSEGDFRFHKLCTIYDKEYKLESNGVIATPDYQQFVKDLESEGENEMQAFKEECKAKGMVGYATNYRGRVDMEFYANGIYKDFDGEGYYTRIPGGILYGNKNWDGEQLIYNGKSYAIGTEVFVNTQNLTVKVLDDKPVPIAEYCRNNKYGESVDLTFYWF